MVKTSAIKAHERNQTSILVRGWNDRLADRVNNHYREIRIPHNHCMLDDFYQLLERSQQNVKIAEQKLDPDVYSDRNTIERFRQTLDRGVNLELMFRHGITTLGGLSVPLHSKDQARDYLLK